MKEIDTSIVLLTLNPGEKFKLLLKAIFNQEYRKFEVILIDSASTDNTLNYAKEYPIRIFKIQRNEFGHGKTRNLGARLAKGRYVVYITQDAIPANKYWLTNIIKNLRKENVAGSFGRQIPYENANPLDLFNYNEDYPNRKKIIDKKNYNKSNVLYSDANSALKKKTVIKYPYRDILVSEDLGWALDVIKNNYKIVYEPKAAVIHSHAFNFKNIFKVTFDQGVSFSQIFQNDNSNYLLNNSKNRLIRKIRYLIKNHMFKWLFVAFITDTAKFIAIFLGKNNKLLPKILLKSFSNFPRNW